MGEECVGVVPLSGGEMYECGSPVKGEDVAGSDLLLHDSRRKIRLPSLEGGNIREGDKKLVKVADHGDPHIPALELTPASCTY